MAARPKGFGLTAETDMKLEAKYNAAEAEEAMRWIAHYVPDLDVGDQFDSGTVQEKLKDGVVLCNLINALKKDSVKKINPSKMAFKQMENIGNFLSAAEAFGVKKADLFQTVVLYEGTNMSAVILTIHALGRKASAYGFQGIGPKEAVENKREFTEEQKRAGEGVIGLQMGSNKGASQAGQNFGKTRAIID